MISKDTTITVPNDEFAKLMEQNGVKPDKNGQYQFADVVFFDQVLAPEQKIYWLEQCPGQEERIAKLKGEASVTKT